MKTSAGYNRKYRGYKSRLFNYRFSFILLLVVYPYLVGFAPDSTSSSNTFVDLLIGFGQHSNVAYDCSGKPISAINYSSFDYGASINHNIDILEVGARTGGYKANVSGYKKYSGSYSDNYHSPEDNSPVFYVNPFIGLKTEYFGFNMGFSLFSRDSYSSYFYSSVGKMSGNLSDYLIGEGKIHPTWSMIIGSRSGFFFSTQYLSNVPIITGGGMADVGFGIGSRENRNLTWIGTSFGPYQTMGLCLRQDIQLSDKIDLLLRGRAGLTEDNFEGGLSAGVRIDL